MNEERIFTSYGELRKAIGANKQAVVVECGSSKYKIYGHPLNPNKDINSDCSHVRHQLNLWQAGAKLLNKGRKVEIVEGVA